MPTRPRKAVAATQKPDFAKLLAGAKLPERTVQICMRADLVADHESADADLNELLRRPVQRLSGDGRGALRQKLIDLEAEMKANTYPFRLRGLPKPEFRKLVREHPPRRTEDGNGVEPRDAALGLDVDTFFDDLLRACLSDPELSDEQWTLLLGTLTDKQFDQLATAAWDLNREAVDIPFSRAASLLTESSDSE